MDDVRTEESSLEDIFVELVAESHHEPARGQSDLS